MSHSHPHAGTVHRHAHEHTDGDEHRHDAAHDHARMADAAAACDGAACSGSCAPVPLVAKTAAPVRGRSFRISTMDCAAEEAEIRRALDGLSGIRGLRF